MAGGINLTPNLPVILGQGLLFSLAYGVVRSWIVGPYHLLREARSSLTSGVMDDVSDVSAQILARKNQMEEVRLGMYEEIRKLREQTKESALGQARSTIEEAHRQAEADLAQRSTEIEQNLQEQVPELVGLAQGLSESIYKRLMDA